MTNYRLKNGDGRSSLLNETEMIEIPPEKWFDCTSPLR
jgi:hypothetical protein